MSNFVEEFTRQKQYIESLAIELKDGGYLDDRNVSKIRDILSKEKINIAIIGQMKYGKSTFINSFIFKREFLPTSSTPMTAALSFIEYGDRDSYEVTFFTQEEFEKMENQDDGVFKESVEKAKSLGRELYRLLGSKKEISATEFEEYVGADGKYTPIVKMLTVKTPNDILKEAVVVDTPGFNDPVESRNEIAFDFIEKADVIILFLYAGRPFDNTDREIIIDKLQKAPAGRLVVVVNKSDMLLEEYGTFERVREYVVSKYTQTIQTQIASPELQKMLLSADIISISSLMALLGRMDMNEIKRDETLKWHFDKYNDEFGGISQTDLLEKSEIKSLENSIEKIVKEDKIKILIDKVKGELISSLKRKNNQLLQEKLEIEQDLENIKNLDEIDEKREIIEKFVDEEFDDVVSMSNLLENLSSNLAEYKEEHIIKSIDNNEKELMKQIGKIVNKEGTKKGSESLKDKFREFNIEVKRNIRDIYEILKDMRNGMIQKIEDIFKDIKEHKLSTKFNIRTSTLDKMKESILSLQIDNITKAVDDIKLSLPSVDTGWFGNSKEEIKDRFFDFSDNYFDSLRESVNIIFNDVNTLLIQKLGVDSELKREFRKALITPLEKSLNEIEAELKKNTNLKEEKETALQEITQEEKLLDEKIKEVERKLQNIAKE